MVPAPGQEIPSRERGGASSAKTAPVVTADFGRRDQDGEPCISLVASGAVFATGTFPGTLKHAMAFAGQVNAIPAARDAMLAVLAVCRSDETDVELPSSVIEKVRDALAELEVWA